MLEKIMQDLFLGCIGSSNTSNLSDPEVKQQLRHVLKSYALLSKQRLCEQLFTDHLVKPYMSQVENFYSKSFSKELFYLIL